MELAVIPPICRIQDIQRTRYQLILPNVAHKSYYDAYRDARKRGDYLILDNGAAEGKLLSASGLVETARALHVHEVVVPDVLGDMTATLDKVSHFYDVMDEDFNYMAVVQGQTWQEVTSCITAYSHWPWITTLGIPRHLIDTMGEVEIRSAIAMHVRYEFADRFEIHLLGTSPSYIRELERFHYTFDQAQVRGVDTSAPYNYTRANKVISHYDNVARMKGYFELPSASLRTNLLEENLTTIQGWVNGHSGGVILGNSSSPISTV